MAYANHSFVCFFVHSAQQIQGNNYATVSYQSQQEGLIRRLMVVLRVLDPILSLSSYRVV